MQKLLKLKTTDDAVKDRVYNLDSDPDDNFVVYQAGTISVAAGNDVNILKSSDDEKLEYTFENPDATLRAVGEGAILSYQYAAGLLIIKVKSMEDNYSSDGTITLYGEETSMEEVFDYVKIDTDKLGKVEVDDSTCDPGVTPVDKIAQYDGWFIPLEDEGNTDAKLLSQSFSLEKTIAGNGAGTAEAQISGSIDLTLGFNLQFYYNIPELEFYAETSLSCESSVKVAISGSLDLKEINLANISMMPIPGVAVALTPAFVIKASGEVSLDATITGSVGCKVYKSAGFNLDMGIEDTSIDPTCTTELKVEAELFIGFSLKPAVGVISTDVAKIELEGLVGGVISGKMTKQLATSGSERHACQKCIAGDISVRLEVSARAQLFDKEWLKVEQTLVEVTIHLTDFYYSIDHKEFRKGECPHREYLVTLQVKDKGNHALQGVKIDDSVTDAMTDANGVAKIWMKSGTRSVTASKDGYESYQGSKNITGAYNWQIQLGKKADAGSSGSGTGTGTGGSGTGTGGSGTGTGTGGTGSGSGTEREKYTVTVWVRTPAGNPVKGADVSMSVMQARTDDSGRAQFTAVRGVYMLAVEKESYKKAFKAVSLNQDRSVEITLKYDKKEDNAATKGVQVVLASEHCAVVTGDGSLYTWGNNMWGKVGHDDHFIPQKILDNVAEVALGLLHSAAVTEDGTLYIWGGNSFGQLGDGTRKECHTPKKIMDNVATIKLSTYSNAAITKDGSLYTWGYNNYGQLGDGTKENRSTPKKILDDVLMVNLGGAYSEAVTEDGDLYTWGNNSNGQLGDGTTEDRYFPQKILENVVMAIGCAAITEDGSLYMWGPNNYGQLGYATPGKFSTIPTKVLDKVVTAHFSSYNSVAVTEDGSLYTWGRNDSGQLGDGTYEDKNKPTKIMDNVEMVYHSDGRSAAVTTDGCLYMWGKNFSGQLGDGTYEDKNKPTKIMEDVAKVCLRSRYSEALKKDGTLYLWGENDNGQIGDGTTEERIDPQLIMRDVLDICNGPSVAITTDGSLYMWGSSDYCYSYASRFPKKFLTDVFSAGALPGYDAAPMVPEEPGIAEDSPELMDSPAVTFSDVAVTQDSKNGTETVSAKGLKKQAVYNLYVVKSALDGEDLLASSNLLYLGQGVSGEDGKLSLSYQPRESCDAPVYLLVSMDRDDIAEADVTLDALDYTGSEQYVSPVVSWHGEPLIAGKDYELQGDFAATEVGSYTVVIHGIDQYTGDLPVGYQVRCPHAGLGSWETVTAATCTAAGLRQRKCTLCGETAETEEIAKLAHTVGEWEVVTAATCAAAGSRQKKCTVCGAATETEEIAKLAHTVGEWEVVTAATVTAAGKRQKKCTVCGEVTETEEIEKLNAPETGDSTDSGNGADSENGGSGVSGAYRIVYSLSGGTNAASNPSSYSGTAAVKLADPTRTGYTFGGWYSDITFKKNVTEIAQGSTGNQMLYAKWTANKYTISFDGNGGSGSMKAMANRSYDTVYELAANKFRKSGSGFIGWNTKADGSGTAYRNLAGVENLSEKDGDTVTLYAQWKEGAYAITYHISGGSNDPANPDWYDDKSAAVTLKTPTRAGYTFAGWYSDSKLKKAADSIAAGSKGDKDFYVKWTANKYTIKFDGNAAGIIIGGAGSAAGGSGSNVAVTGSMSDLSNRVYGKKYTLPANKLKKAGYTFLGWNTKADGSGTPYRNKASVQNLTTDVNGTVTLYAQWEIVKYTITYKLNGGTFDTGAGASSGIGGGTGTGSGSGTGGSAGATNPNPATYNAETPTIALKAPVKDGYTFDGWYTDAKFKKDKLTELKTGSSGKKTLYAKWTPNKYTVKFDGNGATSGEMAELTDRVYGKKYTLKKCVFKKDGATFAGWNTKADGSGDSVKDKAKIKSLTKESGGTVTLYALWK